MEFETLSASHQPKISRRLLSAAVPVLFVAISYVDPGKWAAAVEGGAHFGSDLVLPVLIFNFAAIFCQYMSARIAVITGKDLAQICSEEYDNVTCIFLGAQAEVSMIALDLMMVLGTAYGLNILFGIDLFTGVFLTAVNAALFLFLAILVENGRVKVLSICLSIYILLFYFCGVFTSQPGNPLSMGGMLSWLSGESAFALMSLLGAHIMPHNFYLHSSVVQQDKQPTNVPKGALCYDHFFAILCIFGGIFLVNYLIMNSAANAFYTTGLLNFQDALSLLDQVFRSSVAPMALIVLMFFSNQITALSWNLGGQVVVNALFKMDIPGWLHHATIRIIAIIPALCCVWNSGAEGIYQMLIFTQVVVALLLPSSVIPLFRVASSRTIMGIYKTSQFEEFLVLITFVGMLGLEVIFFLELMFGNSEWVTNLMWNTGRSVPIAYVFLVGAASVSFCLMLWLAATPLKSATSRIDTQVLEWNIQNSVPETFVDEEQNDVSVSKYPIDKPREKQEPPLALEKASGSFPDLSTTLNLPDTLYDSENGLHLTSSKDKSEIIVSSSSACHEEVSAAEGDTNSDTTNRGEVSDSESQDAHALKTESVDVVENTLRMEGELQNLRDNGDSWEQPEEPTKEISETNQSLTSEGPGSFRSLSGKNDDAGSGAGSLSRLAGLGRAARRQLTAILDEFWGQIFDFHGQATAEAKAKKLDLLLGLDFKEDLKSSSASVKLDSSRKDPAGYFPSVAGGGTDSLIPAASALYNSPKQQGQSMFESSYGVQRGSSPLWSPPHMQLLDTYGRSASRNPLDSSERRYSSMRIPASSDGYDQQPATVHGYQLSSYLNRMTQERGSGFLNGQIESLASKSTSSVMSHYGDSFARPSGRKTPNGVSALKPPGFHNIPVSRNSSLQPDRPVYELSSAKPAENVNTSVTPKKFHSLPDISGLRVPHQDSSLLDKSGHWDNPAAYGQTMGSSTYERTYSSFSSTGVAPSGFIELSPKVCRDAFSLQISSDSSTGSLWSRQPFEQFGVADKSLTDSNTHETALIVDLEVKLLQSFRHCIMKLRKLEGSDWLFRQNDGADEDLIDRVAAREGFLYEAESVQMNRPNNASLPQFYSEADHTKFLVTSIPHCGEGCVYKVHLIISFGVWCIHRVLELSLVESRPELWGKYTYVLNRLQGIVDPAFFKPRSPMTPCFCFQLPDGWQQKSSPPSSNGSLPPHAKQGRGKCTTAAMVLDMIKDVEMAIACRKGRQGTAAGDVAFPKGKENLASVLKRYKRRLLNRPTGSQESGSLSRPSYLHYGL